MQGPGCLENSEWTTGLHIQYRLEERGDRFSNQEDGLRSLDVINFKCKVVSSIFDRQTHHRILGAFPNYTCSRFMWRFNILQNSFLHANHPRGSGNGEVAF